MRHKNTYFQFKNFKIEQRNSAMKVSTDACIFGIISAQNYQNLENKRVLDIGAGSGLLSLIWAQIHPEIMIDSVEIDELSCVDCQSNFHNSGFESRLNLFNESIQNFNSTHLYDIIISNPPFFINSLKNQKKSLASARHADVSLSIDDVFRNSARFMHSGSHLITLYPYNLSDIIIETAETHGIKPFRHINIQSYLDSEPHCVIQFWDRNGSAYIDKKIFTIYAHKGQYTEEFISLVKDFYLNI